MISMSGVKTKLRQIKYMIKHDFLTIENVVLAMAILLCFVWTFQSIKAMSRNWELSERLTAEKKELELLEKKVETAEIENEYFRSEEYQELVARKQLDKQFEGEKMVVMPDNSEEAKNKYKKKPAEATEKQLSNFEKWMKFLFPNY